MNPFQGTQGLLQCVPRMRTESSVAGLALTSPLTEPTQPCVNPRSVDGQPSRAGKDLLRFRAVAAQIWLYMEAAISVDRNTYPRGESNNHLADHSVNA
jgi:hypothetical protein